MSRKFDMFDDEYGELVPSIDEFSRVEHSQRALRCPITNGFYSEDLLEDPYDLDDRAAQLELLQDPEDRFAIPPDTYDPQNPLLSHRIIA